MAGISFSGVILDLDGVITDTRRLHFASWCEVFNNFFAKSKIPHQFNSHDYERFIDGKPREEGIEAYLLFLGIALSKTQIESIGRDKNNAYHKLLQQEDLLIFPDVLPAMAEWRKKGIGMAVISSSQNCKLILKKLGLENAFDACVDGVEGKRLQLQGKPEADYLLEAVQRLGKTSAECILVEDSLSGIAAGVKGHFKNVIGISRKGQTPRYKLYAEGADLVVSTLLEIGTRHHALKEWSDFKDHVGARDLALFIDYDGTISNIVPNPSDARLDESLRKRLKKIAKASKVIIVSGRDRIDVKKRVGIENVFYAGCHGLDISGPGCFHYQVDSAWKIIPDLHAATLAISNALEGIEGIIIEKKHFTTAIHYRMVTKTSEKVIKEKVIEIAKTFQRLKLKEGKKVIELYPNIQWGKGEAVKKMCEILNINPTHTVPIYIGDDLTDEEAFQSIHGQGIGIKVGDGSDTRADYILSNPNEVEELLTTISQFYIGEEKRWRSGL